MLSPLKFLNRRRKAASLHTISRPHPRPWGGVRFLLYLTATLLCSPLHSLHSEAAEPPAAVENSAKNDSSDAPADSSDTEREEKPIVVTATRIAQPKEAVSTPLETILRREIERSGARSAAELLQNQSLVDIRNYGGLGNIKVPTLRGLSAEQTLVLLDGRRLNPPQGGGVDLSDVDLTGVRRVEILRGPASALYGSDALGGVIQLITEMQEGPAQTTVGEESGSYGYHSLRFSRSEKVGKLGYVLSARRLTTQGDFPYDDPIRGVSRHRTNAEFGSTSVHATLLPEFGGKGKLRVHFDWTDSERGAPGTIQTPSTAVQYDRLSALDVSYRLGDSRQGTGDRKTRTEIRAYVQGQRRLYDALLDRPIPIYTLQKIQTNGLELTGNRDWGRSLLAWGMELRDEQLRASNVGEKGRNVFAAYSQGQVRRGSWTLIPAVRWDRITGAGSQASPQVGLLGRLSSEWTLRANLGQAFRAPSLNDLYWPEDPFSLGNPGLRPERAVTSDAGIGYKRGGWSADLTSFQTRVRDLIVWSPGHVKPGKYSPGNVGRASINGLELTTGYRKERWNVRLGGSTLNAQDQTPGSNSYGKQLTYRPSSQLHLNLDWQNARWGAGTDLVYGGRRYASADNTTRLGGYTLVNLRVRRRMGAWEAGVSLDNLFARRYQVLAGYPLPGREARVSLQQRF